MTPVLDVRIARHMRALEAFDMLINMHAVAFHPKTTVIDQPQCNLSMRDELCF